MKVVAVLTTPSAREGGQEKGSALKGGEGEDSHTDSGGEEASVGSVDSDAFEL